MSISTLSSLMGGGNEQQLLVEDVWVGGPVLCLWDNYLNLNNLDFVHLSNENDKNAFSST